MLKFFYMKRLAINGGPKIRKNFFPFCTSIGEEEIKAVTKVLKSGILSQFIGCEHENFYGGSQVKALEKDWAKYFKVKHAVSVNSATSALIAAVGAAGVGPGDEVIVTPYSMCISATAPLFYGALPVFADIEKNYFCLDPKSVEEKITERTKAIIVVDIFGQPYDAEAINKIAKKHKLIVIEDASQAPGAKYKNKFSGTLGDVGIFSLNYHKHIHCGEGGILATNNDDWAERARLIRNHAEAVVPGRKMKNLVNMLGYNFRMTELEAAVARQQLKKLKKLFKIRIDNVRYLENKLSPIPFIKTVPVRKNCTHSFYILPLLFNSKIVGISRNRFVEAVVAELPYMEKRENEGVLIEVGYVKPLYLMPIFKNLKCYGNNGYPFNQPEYKNSLNYKEGLAPNAEFHHKNDLITLDLIKPGMSREDLDDVARAFLKVWKNIDELK